MSYSVQSKCSTCKKETRCTDRHVIMGAVQGIHSMPINSDFGHLGAGSIVIDCIYHEGPTDETAEQPESKAPDEA